MGTAMNTSVRPALALFCLALAFSSRAADEPPTVTVDSAVIADTGTLNEGVVGIFPPGSSATFFVLEKVDGAAVKNAIEATRRASFGLGPRLRVVSVRRPVVAGKVRITLVGRVVFGAPIVEILGGGSAPSVEGEEEVELRPGVQYRVTGVLDSFRREVWLEETETHAVIGRKIPAPLDPKQAADLAAADRFLCCNLRYEEGWITDDQPIGSRFVPAGARVRILGWGKNRAEVSIEGRKFNIGPFHGYFRGTREEFAALALVETDPALRLATWPADVQAAVAAGRVKTGMTREQVLMAIGYPRSDRTGPLESANWTYYTGDSDNEFDLDWSPDGALARINAPSAILARVVAQP